MIDPSGPATSSAALGYSGAWLPRLYIALSKGKSIFFITSGRRVTWPRNGVWSVNPDQCGMGFAEIAHMVSHYIHRYVNPGLWRQRGGSHSGHALVEQHLVDYAVQHRWVEDGLKVTMKN